VKDSSGGNDYSAGLAVPSARRLNPHESAYAVAAGNLALDLRFGNIQGPKADLAAARAAYQEAVDMGTTNPVAFRGLAIADFRLGDARGAIDAARRAVELNRFDLANLALLRSLQSQQP
jgi:tetratricopeptide (TPR) repeat protein